MTTYKRKVKLVAFNNACDFLVLDEASLVVMP